MRFDDANQSYKAILADMNDVLERLGEEWERVQYKKRRELPELKKNKFSTSAESYTSKWTGTVWVTHFHPAWPKSSCAN